MRALIRYSTLVLALSILSGCDLVGILAKEAVVSAASHRGWDTFTFKGQLPAEFGIDAIAFYGPNDSKNASCRAPSYEPGKTITRRYAKRYTAEIQAQPQGFSFEIPLSYYQGLCGMRLGRVKLEIKARYGEQKWQRTYANGGFNIERYHNEKSAQFNPQGQLKIVSKCQFSFQESKLFGEISKFLTCKGAGANLAIETIPNKQINLHIQSGIEEKPFMRNRWIKTDMGWKPCLPTEKSNRCQNPPIFKEFKMNGQICTIYPDCAE